MKKRNIIIAIFAVMILSGNMSFIPAALNAQDTLSKEKDWQFQLAPYYLWYIAVEGDQTVGTNTSEIDMDLGDLTGGLNAAFIANFQGFYKEKWGFFFDYNYAKFGGNGNLGPIELDFTTKLQLVELAALYRITHSKHFFDIKVGARYMGMDPDIKTNSIIGSNSFGQKQDWVDPIIGLRWVWNFADQWKLAALGDIGGFGVGSDLTWQGALTIDWKPFKNVSFRGGYRALYVDYENGTHGTPDYFNFDATMHGPLLGVVFQW